MTISETFPSPAEEVRSIKRRDCEVSVACIRLLRDNVSVQDHGVQRLRQRQFGADNSNANNLNKDMNNFTSNSPQDDAELLKLVLAPTERHYLTEAELADRWNLSPKTLQRWRGLGTGPLFAKFAKKVGYPLLGQGGILNYEESILHRSTTQRAIPE